MVFRVNISSSVLNDAEAAALQVSMVFRVNISSSVLNDAEAAALQEGPHYFGVASGERY
jgi:hypothetical protein